MSKAIRAMWLVEKNKLVKFCEPALFLDSSEIKMRSMAKTALISFVV